MPQFVEFFVDFDWHICFKSSNSASVTILNLFRGFCCCGMYFSDVLSVLSASNACSI